MNSQALIRNLLLLFLIVFLVSSTQAFEKNGLSNGGQTIHGGSADLAKAGGDTINLMASHNDPTNNSDPRDGGLEPYYYGDFEDADGDPSWNGWTHTDMTQPTDNHWNVSNYNQPDPSNHAAWCGDIDFVSCGLPDPDGGYGNNWHDILEFRQTVPNPGTGSTVSITATLIYDSEPGYDYTHLSYNFNGQGLSDLHSWDESGTAAVIGSVTYLPQEYLDGTDIAIYFRFQSDAGWSDEDCLWPTAGACQVDDINVHLVNGEFTGDFFEDFEHDGDPADFGLWNTAFPQGVGDFAKIWPGLDDADPCNINYTPQVAFIDDGIVVPGTGGSECINWCYGPSGYIVTTTGGLAGPGHYLFNVIESPVMAWPAAKNAGEPDYDGIFLTYNVYAHENLSPSSPGNLYSFQARSADTDGSDGDPQVITEQDWVWGGYFFSGGPSYRRETRELTLRMNPGRDEVQVQLLVWDSPNFNGHDGTPAPYFDNVTVKVFPYGGPYMDTFEGLSLAHDDFPERGSIDFGDLGSHSVRFDMEKIRNYSDDQGYDFGDSLVITIGSVRSGADLDGDPEMHYIMDRNPVFDPYRTAGLPAVGSVTGWPAVGATGEPSPDRWAFDLPDTGFLFPGDVLHYYFSATDAIGGLGGSDPRTALMPADTTGFSTGFGDPLGYHPVFTVQALPSIRPDGEGGYEQPGILVINDDRRLGMPECHTALNNIGLLVNEDYDMYVVNSSTANGHSGIGARATHLTLEGYDDILYTSGNQGIWTLGNGDLTSDDVTPLTNWLDLGGKDIFLTGDNLAQDLSQTGSAALNFLESYMGVTLVTSDVRSFIGNQTTPLVKATADNPVFYSPLETWIAFGGCPTINTFNGVNSFGTGQRLAEFTDSAGQAGQYTFSAATLNIINPGLNQSRVISMPVALAYINTNPAAPGNDLPGRAQLLEDVLNYFGVAGDPQNVSAVPTAITFKTSNYPNPFNPSTTIKYSMPAAGHLKLSIYNVRGQLVKTLIDGNRPAGADQTIIWDGTNNQGSATASGVYFYEARTGGEVKIRKMALLK